MDSWTEVAVDQLLIANNETVRLMSHKQQLVPCGARRPPSPFSRRVVSPSGLQYSISGSHGRFWNFNTVRKWHSLCPLAFTTALSWLPLVLARLNSTRHGEAPARHQRGRERVHSARHYITQGTSLPRCLETGESTRL